MVITDAKAELHNMTLEKHHDLTRDRMFQKMKNASATEPISLTIDGHPAVQDELTGTEKGTNVVFLHTTVDDGDYFQPRMLLLSLPAVAGESFRSSGDAQVPLATTPNAFGAARNYPKFSQRASESLGRDET